MFTFNFFENIQTSKFTILKNDQNWKIFNFFNNVQILTIFTSKISLKIQKCSNLKIFWTKKSFKFENCSIFLKLFLNKYSYFKNILWKYIFSEKTDYEK
jgi:hypothetical protein